MEQNKSLIEVLTPMQQLVDKLQFEMHQIIDKAKGRTLPEPCFIGGRLYYKLVEKPKTWEQIYANIEAAKINLHNQIDEAFYMERMWRTYKDFGYIAFDRGITVIRKTNFTLITDRTA